MWVGAGACSILYLPAKAIVALGMGIGGGASYAYTYFTDEMDLSQQIIGWGYYGDWLIRPEHLTLDEYPEIIGFSEEIPFC